MTAVRKMGIVGVGPRGGYALERLVVELAQQNSLSNIQIALFESTGCFGNGTVYDTHQSSSNWINITERALKLEQRKAIQTDAVDIPTFPSYHEWAGKDYHQISETAADVFPPRGYVGEYLAQRFQTLVKPLIEAQMAVLHEEKVTAVQWLANHQIQVTTPNRTEPFDEVLLTIGHQPTESSQQIIDWEEFVADQEDVLLFKSPYPVAAYLNHEQLMRDSAIGIRGFGLAMIDAARAIAEQYGTFEVTDERTKALTYQIDEEAALQIVPFSLNGQPPAPKPLNARIDNWFQPSEEQLEQFKAKIGDEQTQRTAQSSRFLIAAIAPIVVDVYTKLPNALNPQQLSKTELEELVIQWLEADDFKHPLIVSTKQPPAKTMQQFVDMATGTGTITLDYCIGAVWRFCQPTIYEQLSYNACTDDVFGEIIKLDEWTKRYSYGPPVESIQQMLALAHAGVMNLSLTNDPEIELTSSGWTLQKNDKTAKVSIMIDSVLNPPQIKTVCSPIVESLFEDDLIHVVHDDFGVATDECGYLISSDKKKIVPVALLGRLAKGTVIGVDAILECFGSRPMEWAAESAQHHVDWLQEAEQTAQQEGGMKVAV